MLSKIMVFFLTGAVQDTSFSKGTLRSHFLAALKDNLDPTEHEHEFSPCEFTEKSPNYLQIPRSAKCIDNSTLSGPDAKPRVGQIKGLRDGRKQSFRLKAFNIHMRSNVRSFSRSSNESNDTYMHAIRNFNEIPQFPHGRAGSGDTAFLPWPMSYSLKRIIEQKNSSKKNFDHGRSHTLSFQIIDFTPRTFKLRSSTLLTSKCQGATLNRVTDKADYGSDFFECLHSTGTLHLVPWPLGHDSNHERFREFQSHGGIKGDVGSQILDSNSGPLAVSSKSLEALQVLIDKWSGFKCSNSKKVTSRDISFTLSLGGKNICMLGCMSEKDPNIECGLMCHHVKSTSLSSKTGLKIREVKIRKKNQGPMVVRSFSVPSKSNRFNSNTIPKDIVTTGVFGQRRSKTASDSQLPSSSQSKEIPRQLSMAEMRWQHRVQRFFWPPQQQHKVVLMKPTRKTIWSLMASFLVAKVLLDVTSRSSITGNKDQFSLQQKRRRESKLTLTSSPGCWNSIETHGVSSSAFRNNLLIRVGALSSVSAVPSHSQWRIK